jgi:hypothetical protein
MSAFARIEAAGAWFVALSGLEDVFEEGGVDLTTDFRGELREEADFGGGGQLGVVLGHFLRDLLRLKSLFFGGRHS